MRSIPIVAYDVATSFDLPALATPAALWGAILSKDPLILHFSDKRYIVVFEYGSVVFFNFTTAEMRDWLTRLQPYAARMNRREFTDNFMLHVGAQEGETSKEELGVTEFNLDIVKLVAIVLSRSVSLEYYEDKLDRSLERLEDAVEQLSRTGKLVGDRQNLSRQVGVALNIQHELAYNLELLDDPDVVWESGRVIEKLYEQLTLTFDIRQRVQVLERKMAIVSKSGEFIIQRLHDRTMVRQEYAIIGLFILDLVLIFWEIIR